MRPLAPGDPAPDIRLRTPFDVEVALHLLLEQGPVAVEFIRGTWDPDARLRLQDLSDAEDRLRVEYRARSLVVTCERALTARAYLEAHPGAVPVLIDALREATKAYGVFQRFSFGAFDVARPATFLVDRCGFVRYVHVGRSPIRSAPMEEIFAALEGLKREADRARKERP